MFLYKNIKYKNFTAAASWSFF